MYIKIEISLGHDCNASCVFCYSALVKDKMTMPTKRVMAVLEDYRNKGYNYVSFTGGEPTIRKDIFSLISYAKRLDYEVGLKTNLFMLSYPSFVEKLKTAGLDSVSFSVFGFGDDVYRKITGIEKGFSYLAKALDNLKTSPISLTANILISGYSCKDILKLTDFLLSYNISSFWFWYVSSSELTKIPEGLLPCFSSFREDLFSSIDKIKSKGIDDIKVLHIPMCVLDSYANYYYNERSDDVTIIDLNSTFKLSEESFADLIKLERCNICIRNEECAGLRKDYQKGFGDSEIDSIKSAKNYVKNNFTKNNLVSTTETTQMFPKLGLTTTWFKVSSYCKDPRLADCRVLEIGKRSAQMTSFYYLNPIWINKIKSYLRGFDLSLHSGTSQIFTDNEQSTLNELNILKSEIGVCSLIGAKELIFHLNNKKLNKKEVEKLREVINFSKKHDINMVYESDCNSSSDIILDFLRKFPDVDYNLDLGHLNVEYNRGFLGCQMNNFIKKIKDKVVYVHAHNNNGNEDEHKALRDGTLNWKKVLDFLDLNKVKKIISETRSFEDDMKNIEDLKAYLKTRHSRKALKLTTTKII